MFTCNESDRFLSKVLAGLMIAVTMAVGCSPTRLPAPRRSSESEAAVRQPTRTTSLPCTRPERDRSMASAARSSGYSAST